MAKTRIPLNPEWEINQKREAFLASAVAELDLDQRTVNGLEEVGIIFVKDLIKLTEADLGKVRNFGAKSVERIIQVLNEHGVALEG